ncbi:MAG: hypothetical protein JWO75_1247 [Actinomycetia bacterium]|nr:hypothetical protein [Actinomycetes bacterium]
MARAKRSRPKKTKVNIRRRNAGQREPAWHWRLGSLLLVGAIGFVLAPKSVAEAAELKAPVKPQLNVVDIGDLYSYGYATSSAPALRKSVPPTLQALNQVQAANSGVRLKVLFIPVPAATSSALFDSGNNELPALINAVAHSSVVIVGVGGGNTPLAGSMRSVLFGTAAPADAFPQLMTSFDDGYYLYNQEGLLSAIAAHAAPGTSIVTLGYPAIAGKQGTSGFSWWSPYTWGTVSQAQANMSDQLVSALNTADGQATSMVAAAHPDLHFLYADLSGATLGTGPSGPVTGSQQGQTRPTDTAIGSDLLPYVSQAAGNKLVTMNVHAAQGTPLVTSASPWQLSVVLPVSAPATPQHATAAATPSPQNNQDNPSTPVYEPLVWPGFPAQPSRPATGGLPPGGAGSGGPATAASPAVGSTSTAQAGNGQGQPLPGAQAAPTGQAASGDHPTGGLLLPVLSPPAQPSDNGTSASTGNVKTGLIVTLTSGADSGNYRSPSATPPKKTPSPGKPPALPMIPAPPSPLPKPITTDAPAPGAGSEPGGAPGTKTAATPPNTVTTSQPPASSQPPGNNAAAPMASPSTTPSAGQPVTPTSPTTPTTPATTPGAPGPSTGSDATGSPGTTPTATPSNTVTPPTAFTAPTVATPPSTPAAATPAAGTPTASTPTASTPAPATPTASTPTAATPAPPTPTAATPASATPASATGGGGAPGNVPSVSGVTAPSGSTAPAPAAAS